MGERSLRAGGEKLPNILLIAGPSGCGKSTLIAGLRAGRLAGLPEAARTWPDASAKEILRGRRPLPALEADRGLIVHYDTMRVLAEGYDDYGDDPAIGLLEAADGPLLAVTLACSREMLFTQFLTRAVTRSDGTAPGRFAALKRGIRHLHRRAFGPPRVSLPRMDVNKLAVYGSDRKFFDWAERWQACLARLAKARGDVTCLAARPAPSESGAPTFTLSAAPPLEAPTFAAPPRAAPPLEATPRAVALRASA